MSRSIPFMIILALSANTTSAWAVDEDILSNCENQVQAYGIIDTKEYEMAIEDCINSYTHPDAQLPDVQLSEQESPEIQYDTNPNQ